MPTTGTPGHAHHWHAWPCPQLAMLPLAPLEAALEAPLVLVALAVAVGDDGGPVVVRGRSVDHDRG